MHSDWFFDTARGKIVAALRGRLGASAFDLAREFGLSTNAVRQQFILLERDGLVTASSVRRGKTKPTVEYRLTPAAEKYFPQHYDRMLNAVLREVRAAGGDDAVTAIFESMSRRQAQRLNAGLEERPVAERVAALTELLRNSGVEAEAEETAAGFTIREPNCPYAETVGEHPEICGLIRSVMQDVVAPGVIQTDSLATGGSECRFEITTSSEKRPAAPAAPAVDFEHSPWDEPSEILGTSTTRDRQ
jgi:predicted ArsR family transcriptional regulator